MVPTERHTAVEAPAQVRETHPRSGLVALAGRIVVGGLAIMVAVNLVSGFPILALWIGSRFAGGDVISGSGILIALLALAVLMVLGVTALTRLSALYERLAGRMEPGRREPAPWNRSLRAERPVYTRQRVRANTVERIMIGTVVAAAVVFEVWFFFLAKFALPS